MKGDNTYFSVTEVCGNEMVETIELYNVLPNLYSSSIGNSECGRCFKEDKDLSCFSMFKAERERSHWNPCVKLKFQR